MHVAMPSKSTFTAQKRSLNVSCTSAACWLLAYSRRLFGGHPASSRPHGRAKANIQRLLALCKWHAELEVIEMPQGKPNPSRIMEMGMGFWASKTLLSAVQLQLFPISAPSP